MGTFVWQIISAICFLRGKAYEALENRAQARLWCVAFRIIFYLFCLHFGMYHALSLHWQW